MYLTIRCFFILCFFAVSIINAKTLSTTLDNGMKVVIKEDSRAPVATYQLWYKVGGVDEKQGKTGLSHALEHMMFKGTDKYPSGQFTTIISALGGELNAYTSNDETVYHATVAAKNLPKTLELEADRMTGLNFSDKDFYNEIKVIQEERRMRTEDSPQGKLWEVLNKTAFSHSNYQTPVIGWMNDIANLTPQDLRQWYRTWYVPNNSILVIVGDVNATQLIKQIKEIFGNISARPLPDRQLPKEDFLQGFRQTKTSAPSELPIIALAWRVPKIEKLNDISPLSLIVLTEALSGNSASRLGKNLVREKQIAMSASSIYDPLSRSETLLLILASPFKQVSNDTLIQAIKQEIKNIAEKGISNDELDRIRRNIEARQIYEQDSIESQSHSIGILELLGFGYQSEDELRKNLLHITSKEVQNAAQLLVDDALTEVILLPESIKSAIDKNQ